MPVNAKSSAFTGGNGRKISRVEVLAAESGDAIGRHPSGVREIFAGDVVIA